MDTQFVDSWLPDQQLSAMALAKPDGVLGEVSTVAVTSVTPACPDASGSHMAHRQGLTSFSDNDRGIPLPTATSLPVLGAHGAKWQVEG